MSTSQRSKTMKETTYIFYLAISSVQLLEYYRGDKSTVVAKTIQGNTIQFKADHLRPFVTEFGVYGYFAMTLDERHRFLKMVKLPENK
jgi:hypothetical protein